MNQESEKGQRGDSSFKKLRNLLFPEAEGSLTLKRSYVNLNLGDDEISGREVFLQASYISKEGSLKVKFSKSGKNIIDFTLEESGLISLTIGSQKVSQKQLKDSSELAGELVSWVEKLIKTRD